MAPTAAPYDSIPPVLDVDGAADLIGVSTWSIRKALEDGTIEHVRLGRLIRIPGHAIEKYLSNTVAGTKENTGS